MVDTDPELLAEGQPHLPFISNADGSMDQDREIEADEVSLARLIGRNLDFFRIDGQTRLQFGDTEIIIIAPLLLRTHDREVWIDERDDLGPLLALWPDVLNEATISDDLTLRLRFRSGAATTVPAYEGYEAWHVSGPGKALIVCGPRGPRTLSVWT